MDPTRERIELERNLSFVMGRPFAWGEIALYSDETLRQAYRARAKELHPDRALVLGQNPDDLAERFRELREAYDVVVESRKTGEFFRLFSGPTYRAPYTARPAARPATATADRPSAGGASAYTARSANGASRANDTSRTNGASRANDASRATDASRADGPQRMFHSGSVPPCRLRLAQYLYYSGRIDWGTLIDAIAWQYAVRPKLGTIALETGYMRHEDVMKTLGARNADELFGAAACRLGILTPYALSVLVGRQRLLGLPIGRYFVDRGHLSETELDECLILLARHNFGFPRLAASKPKTRAKR